VLLEESQKVIVWGGNEKGQLGLGHYNDEHSPKLLDFFSK
jgi:alpha-tubulin suppressor-like RCC1 family protein